MPLELAGRRDAARRGGAALGAGRARPPPRPLSRRSSRAASSSASRSPAPLSPGPQLLLADEPTGNLDGATGRLVIDCLFEEHARHGTRAAADHPRRRASPSAATASCSLADGRDRRRAVAAPLAGRGAVSRNRGRGAVEAAATLRLQRCPRSARRELRGGIARASASSSPAWCSGSAAIAGDRLAERRGRAPGSRPMRASLLGGDVSARLALSSGSDAERAVSRARAARCRRPRRCARWRARPTASGAA